MAYLILAALVAWFLLGNPGNFLAEKLWPEGNAPWEQVDAFYYPSSANLTVHQEKRGLANLADCRAWVTQMAIRNGDPRMQRSDYECGIGFLRNEGSLRVYRKTLK